MKLNVLLAKTDVLGKNFNAMIKDFGQYFAKKQGDFKGGRATYEAAEGYVEEPGKKGFANVVTTVDEKLDWFRMQSKDYVDALFSQEATNASGNARAELVVDGESWGEFSSLELLRLRSFVENKDMERMFAAIPTRSDADQWSPTDDEAFRGRKGIFESPLVEGESKTTEKETYILHDPNIGKLKDASSYVPQTAIKNTTVVIGNYTNQIFSGEYSHKQRAEILRKRSVLITAIVEALKKCNEVESISSGITSDKIFDYLLSE